MELIEKKLLKNLVDRKIGYGIVQPGKNVDTGISLIKVNNIISGLSDIKLLDRTTEENSNKYKRTILQGGELIISLVGSVGKTAIVPKSFSGCNLVRATGLIDIKDPVICKWTKYYIDSKYGQNYITNNLNTTVQPTLNIDSLEKMEIPFFQNEYMKNAVNILYSLDSKIELNNKINANLEQQAQALFKSWFIDFEPFGGKMPEGWKVGKLSEIADYLNGLAMQKFRPDENEESLPVLKIKELRQGICDDSSELCSPNKIKPEFIINDGDVIFSWSGSLLVDIWCGGKCGLNQHLFKVTSKNYDKWFYYLWTKHHLNRFIFLAADKATTMGHIKREELDKAEVVIPNNTDYEKLNKILTPIIEAQINNRIENCKLANIRDELLPKLMSGEIETNSIIINRRKL